MRVDQAYEAIMDAVGEGSRRTPASQEGSDELMLHT